MYRLDKSMRGSSLFAAVCLLCSAFAANASTPLPPCLEGSPCPDDGQAPYDLSAYDIPFPVNWPRVPQTTRTVQATTFAEFDAAISTPGTRVLVANGVTLTGNPRNWADDIDIVMPNSARLRLTGHLELTADRVRWTGGAIADGTFTHEVRLRNASDVLFDNVVFEDLDGVNTGQGEFGARLAFINSSGRMRQNFGFFQARYNGSRIKYSDYIVANCDVDTGYPDGEEFGIRLQRVERVVIVDSRVWNGRKHSIRSHHGSRDVFVANNQIEGGSLLTMYADSQGLDTSPPAYDYLGAHYWYDNELYRVIGSGGRNIGRGNENVPASAFDGSVVIEGNRAYHPDQTNAGGEPGRRFANPLLPGDRSIDNIEYPLRTPPAFTGGADH